MLSRLAPLFKTMLRKAESADTRLTIRRDEKEDRREKEEFSPEPEQESDLWTDSTVVSIEALRAFLLTFIKGDSKKSVEQDGSAAFTAAPSQEAAVTPRAAAAVKAYGAAAHTAAGHDHHLDPPPEIPPADEGASPADMLAAEDLRTIYQLIEDLDFLTRQDITSLTIEKADTFLESLVAAVSAQKNRL